MKSDTMNLKTATKVMIGLLVAVSLFHVGILLRIIPYEITWGGRLENDAQMYIFEGISLSLNFLLLALVMIKGGFLKPFLPLKLVNGILWAFVVLFALNTLGNLVAETNFEKLFSVITFLSALFLWQMLTAEKKRSRE